MPKKPARFVTAVAKSTGKKQRIPRDWLDHPVLGADFRLPASSEHRDSGDGPKTSAPRTPATTPVVDKTPATGDDKEN